MQEIEPDPELRALTARKVGLRAAARARPKPNGAIRISRHSPARAWRGRCS